MPLKPAAELFADAYRERYALGYFESWNIESLQGVIDAAEQTRSPIILGFSGHFLTRPDRVTEEKIAWYAALGRAAAASTKVPCCLFFNECPIDAHNHTAMESGFTMIMPAESDEDGPDYVDRVAGLTRLAHERGVAVEAEIEELPMGATGDIEAAGNGYTNPVAANRFIAATGIDLLSVSIGNVHIMVNGERELDIDHLERIRAQVHIPLGLHGGTGIGTASLRRAVGLGVCKVAYGTYIKQRYLSAIRNALGSTEINPHKLLGMGGAEDLLVVGRHAVRDAVLERIELLGCCGKG